MKPASIYHALLLLAALAPGIVHAQYNTRPATTCNDFYLSEGIISGAEINGWNGPPPLRGYVSFPSAMTGAAFITYRHFFTRKFALGFTAGLDNESGDLSYGNPEQTATGLDGISGHYVMHSFTIAPEALLAYFKKRSFMIYGYAGIGATFYDNKCTIYPNAPYGSPVPLPSNPYDYRVTNLNFQLTPFGMRFGDVVAGFFEIGLGYKGIFSGGLSARF